MSEASEPKPRLTPLEIPEYTPPGVNAQEVKAPEQEVKAHEVKAQEGNAQEAKAKKHPRAKKDPSIQKEKRGPARPHRRLTTEVLASRIEKLQTRHDKAKGQLDEAARHLGGYIKEKEMRDSEEPV